MAYTGIFATLLQVQYKAGAYASATSNTETYINAYMAEAESLINCVTCYNWTDAYAALNADVKAILQEAASSKAAMMVINYDTSGFPFARLAELALDVLDDDYNKAIAQLKEKAVREFIVGA